ncbi:hypothetical protein [Methylovorus glucosotrophus]|uniref:Terminase small subunit n=1 Tax=Methylovorus glucosotrophus (strain SIP3-4) TaxID=582744 RepID=C6XEA3_METGS|nr:hypothetical protein [Methylovorus glucosotrophus]ACT50878.1 conserved hypothetical protein [Methylovorus glucosotrophus SIP3-4]
METTESTKKRGSSKPRYKEEYVEQAQQLALLGLIDEQICKVFGVTDRTLRNWKRNNPAFKAALEVGKAVADGKVAEALFKRACGYSHPDTVITQFEGQITKTEVTKHYPPDTAAAFIWLKNRQPTLWRQQVDPTDDNEKPAPVQITVNVVDASIPAPDEP